jgi:hypothetical protein
MPQGDKVAANKLPSVVTTAAHVRCGVPHGREDCPMSAIPVKPPIARRPLSVRPRRRHIHTQEMNPLRVRLARMTIDRYGADAIAQSAMQGNALLAKGDVDGLLAWMTVIMAINRLQGTKPADGRWGTRSGPALSVRM